MAARRCKDDTLYCSETPSQGATHGTVPHGLVGIMYAQSNPQGKCTTSTINVVTKGSIIQTSNHRSHNRVKIPIDILYGH
jgi:hypothetical protein